MHNGWRIGLASGLLLTLVTGCDSARTDSSRSAGPASAQTAEGGADSAARAGAPPAGAGASAKAASAGPVLGRDLVRTGELTLTTTDVPGAIAKATATVKGAGGYVASQQAAINPNDHRRDSATLTLKVPGPSYDAVLPALTRLGTVRASTDQRQDVTGDVIDVTSRLATEEASVARVRTLLARARTIGEVVSVESELTKREASLESLKGRLGALRGQVSYATITLQLSTPSVTPPPPTPRPAGLAGGLQAGWQAFTAVLVGLLTALGAALPFGLTLLVLAPLAVAARRRLARRPASPAAE